MQHTRVRTAIAALSLFSTALIANAGQPGSDWISMEKALSKLKADGYSQISAIEAEHGHWEGKGVKNGHVNEFKIDPHSGRITLAPSDHPGPDWISIGEVLSILKKNGYSQVTEIEADDGHWEGDGIKNGNAYEFHVDPHTGKITKDERDD